jgi:hypothetical protein
MESFYSSAQLQRRERDSNPRYGDPHNGFRDRPIQPLWHLSLNSCQRSLSISDWPIEKPQIPLKRRVRADSIKSRNFLSGFCLQTGRRGRDSNPRYPFEYTHFPGVLLQPLGHLSSIQLNYGQSGRGKFRGTKKSIKSAGNKPANRFSPQFTRRVPATRKGEP